MTEQSSITCPKCGLTSHLRADVQNRYCGKCGYHDADSATPHGIPGVSAKWRQPTPAMQLQATIASLEGSFYLWKEKISTAESFSQMLDRHLNDIRELVPHLASATWMKR